DKEDLKAIIDKILELRKSENIDNKPKKVDRSKNVKQDTKQVAEVPAEIQMWAQELRHLDPETQRFEIIRKLNEEKVDKGLQAQILVRIIELRSQSPSQVVSDIKPV